MEKETQNKIVELQVFEQTIQNILIQKQTLQAQLLEVNNALKELEKTKDTPYKIIGTLMVASNKKELEKDLNEKKEILNLKIKNLEKQETQLKKKAEELQQEILKKIKK